MNVRTIFFVPLTLSLYWYDYTVRIIYFDSSIVGVGWVEECRRIQKYYLFESENMSGINGEVKLFCES